MRKFLITKTFKGIFLALLGLIFLSAVPVASENTTVATVILEPDAVFFEPAVKNDGMAVTVNGPEGFTYRRQFESGQTPYFELEDNFGEKFPDGSCRYELTALSVVDEKTQKILDEYRQLQEEGAEVSFESSGAADLVQTGAFYIENGRILLQSGKKDVSISDVDIGGISAKDQVILDDLIVDGSTCTGFDCVNDENFGFDTLILKENNLRIFFNDTSSSASFPTTNWRITVNDSGNGGASYFSVDDADAGKSIFKIEAGAPSNSLYVEDYGRVGLGTSTPYAELHISEGDTPTVRLDQDGTSGWAPQIWDLAGNETNFFIRDVTNGSRLPFRIRPGAPTSAIDIAADGDVGIGTSGPSAALHLKRSDGSAQILIEDVSTTEDARGLLKLSNNGTVYMTLEDTSGYTWNFQNHDTTFRITTGDGDTSGDVEFLLDDDGNLTIPGTITTGGTTCGGGCDKVFDESYSLPTITEHAKNMRANRYLPAVGPTEENTPINLSEKIGGMLNELETAHLYIEQLHERIENLEKQITALSEKNTE